MAKIILNEGQFKTLLKIGLTPTTLKDKRYPVEPAKVLIIKKFLDSGKKAGEPQRYWGFSRGNTEEIGPDGGSMIKPCFGQMDSTGNVIKNIFQDEMLDLLMHEWPSIYQDEDQRKRFLGKVMEDWYNNKIGLYGSLSVNHL